MSDKTGASQGRTWGERTGQRQHKANGGVPPPGAGAGRPAGRSTAADGLDLSAAPTAAACADIVQGLLGAGETVLLHGKTGAGKSAMLRRLAFEIGTGGDFCGRRVEQAAVMYISPGDPDLAADFGALAELHGRDLQGAVLGLWSGDIADPAAVADKIESSALGGCNVAVIDPDHGAFQWAEAEALAVELRARFGCAAILTGRRGDEYELSFDAVWFARAPMQADLCVLQIDTARRRRLRGRLTFRYAARLEAAVAVHTSERPTLRPEHRSEDIDLIWDALTLHAYDMTKWRFTFDEFRIIVLTLGLQLEDLDTKVRNQKIKRWWKWFLRQKVMRWDETTQCAVLNPEWRDAQRYQDIGATAEALYEYVQREAENRPV